MKLSTVLAVLCATEASAASLLQKFTGGSSQVVLHEGPDLKVPGESPLQYCGPTDDHILTIEKVDLLPNPPKAYVAPLPVFVLCVAMPRVGCQDRGGEKIKIEGRNN